MGNSQKLPNGNMFVGWGTISPNITEFHPNGDMALVIEFPAISYRAFKYDWETTVFDLDKDSINFGNIYTADSVLTVVGVTNNMDEPLEITGYHSHYDQFHVVATFPVIVPPHDTFDLTIKFKPDLPGNYHDIFTINSDINTESLVQRIAQQVFLSGRYHDTIPPTVTVYPSDGAADVSLDTIVTFHFNEPVIKANGDSIKNLDIQDFVIFRETNLAGNDVPFSSYIDTTMTEIALIPDSLSSFQEYYVELMANSISDTCGNIITTACTSSFTTVNDYGINDLKIGDVLDFFPNPGNSYFWLNFKITGPKNIYVWNALGELVFQAEHVMEEVYKIDIHNEKKGIYVIRIELLNNEYSFNFKAIKN
jgi:hypothetical protein